MFIKKIILSSFILLLSNALFSQIITKEDSLNAGLVRSSNATVISGYGQAKVEYNLRSQTGVANITRNVLFFGHKFSDRVQFFSEMELENAKVTGGNPEGEISMEQLFLKFSINNSNYISAGLFIPRIGIINENHLPTTFNGNDRPFVETLVIPSTWRELGICYYGSSRRMPGLNYSLGLINGLNCSNFEFGSGIREGRFEGSNATASNLALTGALLYYINNFRIQVSGYYGGSNGVNQRTGDSLKLDYGAFGTPVALGEFNVQYLSKLIQFKMLATAVNIADADKINRAFAKNTPNMMIGAYAEAGVNIINLLNKEAKRSLVLFARYEYLDLNYKIPVNGISDNYQKKQYLVAGLTFQPVRGVAVKADYTVQTTGQYNQGLYIVNPYSTVYPFYTSNSFFNLGIAYSF
jgi:hypothetical protein